MLTRVRFEASAKTEQEVQDELLALTSAVRSSVGGEWEVEEQTQGTKNGYWGYMTIKRKGGEDGTER